MKIALINHFPLAGSGSGTYTKNIAQYLLDGGYEVAVIFPENTYVDEIEGLEGAKLYPVYFMGDSASEGSSGLDTALPEGALPFNFPCFTTHPRSLTTFADLNEIELKQYLGAFRKTLADMVNEFKPDVIHGQHMWMLSMLGAECGVSTVVTIHGTDMMGCEKWPHLKKYADRTADKCTRALAISHDNFNQARELFPALGERLILLPNGFNETIFYPVKDINRAAVFAKYGVEYHGEQVIFFAGKLTRFKGVDTLLRAVNILEKETNRNFITLIAGDGEEMGMLTDLAKNLGLKTVHFLGNRSQAELRELYNSGDVFAMPSRREPFGLVALEAMACGLPVVATNEGGLPDFVSDTVGELVGVDDYKEMSRAISNQLDIVASKGPERRQEVISYSGGYTQSAFIVKLLNIYREIIH